MLQLTTLPPPDPARARTLPASFPPFSPLSQDDGQPHHYAVTVEDFEGGGWRYKGLTKGLSGRGRAGYDGAKLRKWVKRVLEGRVKAARPWGDHDREKEREEAEAARAKAGR